MDSMLAYSNEYSRTHAAANHPLYETHQLYFWLPTPPIQTVTQNCRSMTCYEDLYQARVKQLIGWPFPPLASAISIEATLFLPLHAREQYIDIDHISEILMKSLLSTKLINDRKQIASIQIHEGEYREIGQIAIKISML